MKTIKHIFLPFILTLCLALSGCGETEQEGQNDAAFEPAHSSTALVETPADDDSEEFSLEAIPDYTGAPYIEVNGGIPYFSESDMSVTTSFEEYSALDSLGRCGAAYACIGQDLMPTEERGSIGQVKPSGWQTIKYDIVDGKYLYNRCHLIGFQLTAENANECNLITGTRYLNIEGMLPFENMTADYIKETGNHVLYRVTPLFDGNDLVAKGVLMEGFSVEDSGDGICFNVFCYNVQPGIEIDYETGESKLSDPASAENQEESTGNASEGNEGSSKNSSEQTYVLNTNSKKFHDPSCSSAAEMKESNKEYFTGSREDLIAKGYSPCGQCKP